LNSENPSIPCRLADYARRFWCWYLERDLPTRFRLVFAVAALVLLCVLLFAPKPWTIDLAGMERPGIPDFVRVYSWIASAFNLVVLAVLSFTARWWAVPAFVKRGREAEPAFLPRWFWVGLGAAMLFLAVTALPRMNYSLNHDERYSLRRAILGTYQISESGEVSLRRVGLRETLYYYVKPNNHVLHSLLARSSLATWRLLVRRGGPDFQEWVLRIPAYLFGVAGVGVLGLMVARMVGPSAGLAAAWLLAIHPWFLRYTTEARGYSMAMCLIPLLLLVWSSAMRRETWRWWFAYAAVQFALLYSYPATLYVLVVLNLATLLFLFGSRAREGSPWPQVGRWFGANSIAAMVVIQLMLPLVPQFQRYMQTGEARSDLSLSWLRDTGAFFFSGVSWDKALSLEIAYLELQDLYAGQPFLFHLCLWGGVILALVGLIRFFSRGWKPAIAVATLLLPAVIAALVAKWNTQHLFEWYLIYFLPGLAAVVGTGMVVTAGWVARVVPFRVTVPIVVVLMLGVYFFFTHPSRAWYWANPIEPSKDSVLLTRGTVDPYDSSQDEILTGSFRLIPDVYDARCVDLRTIDQMIELMRKSDREEKPLFINVGNLWSAAFGVPRMWRLFYETGLFDDFVIMRSFEPTGDHAVARYVPGALDQFDLETFLSTPDFIPNADDPPVTYSERFGVDASREP
jgi:hypothetical protein